MVNAAFNGLRGLGKRLVVECNKFDIGIETDRGKYLPVMELKKGSGEFGVDIIG